MCAYTSRMSRTVYACRVLRHFATFIQSDGTILDHWREINEAWTWMAVLSDSVSLLQAALHIPQRSPKSDFPMIARPLVAPTILVRSLHFKVQAFERWRRARQEGSTPFESGHWLIRLGFKFQMDRADAFDAWTLGYT